jgi:iron complex outermembrane receptor protein
LNFSGAFTEGLYESFPDGQCPVEEVGSATKICNLTGKVLPGNSRWTMAAGSEVTQPLGFYYRHDLVAYSGADFALRSSTFVSANDSPWRRQF